MAKDGTSNTLIAILASGNENCCITIPESIIEETEKNLGKVIEGQLFNEKGESMEDIKKQEELKRQMVKEAAIEAEKIEKEKIEQEKKRKAECEDLIAEAQRLKEEKKYKEALKVLDKARGMGIPEKEGAINSEETEVKNLKDENSWGKKFNGFLKTLLDEE